MDERERLKIDYEVLTESQGALLLIAPKRYKRKSPILMQNLNNLD